MYVDLVSSGHVSFCLFDSVGGAATKAAIEKDAEKAQVGGTPRTSVHPAGWPGERQVRRFRPCVNQIREDTSCHRAASRKTRRKALATQRPDQQAQVHRWRWPEKVGRWKKLVVGNKIFATIIKNQTGGVEGAVAEWWFYNADTAEHPFGIDTDDEIFNLAIATGVVTGSGWYRHPRLSWHDAKGEQGRRRRTACALLREDEALRKTIVSDQWRCPGSKCFVGHHEDDE